jgi:hypothetical protein
MNDMLKNPFVLLIAGILALWLIFKLLKVFLSLFWVILLVFVVMFIFNERFRNAIQSIFSSLFR